MPRRTSRPSGHGKGTEARTSGKKMSVKTHAQVWNRGKGAMKR